MAISFHPLYNITKESQVNGYCFENGVGFNCVSEIYSADLRCILGSLLLTVKVSFIHRYEQGKESKIKIPPSKIFIGRCWNSNFKGTYQEELDKVLEKVSQDEFEKALMEEFGEYEYF